jgi:gamma-glutamyltranspeptidase
MPLEAAAQAPRLSHQWFPDELAFEAPESYPALTRDLKALGHKVVKTGPTPQGDAHSILVIGPNRYLGVADRRINGSAVGY